MIIEDLKADLSEAAENKIKAVIEKAVEAKVQKEVKKVVKKLTIKMIVTAVALAGTVLIVNNVDKIAGYLKDNND